MDFLLPNRPGKFLQGIPGLFRGRRFCPDFLSVDGVRKLPALLAVPAFIYSAGLWAQDISMVRFEGNNMFKVTAGTEQTIRLTFNIDDRYHIQGADLDNEYLIPTRLTFTEQDGIRVISSAFPPTKKFWMNGVDEPLEVFDHLLVVDVTVKTAKTRGKKQYPVKGNLYYQACDSFKCYYPRSLDFIFILETKR